mmetsp:Transcript_10422/g.20216  ORF Transcript_10422/g.20216 Transcript_10422/m.20216 type:complete len:260 (-) Transcript_10422:2152-2931(-)
MYTTTIKASLTHSLSQNWWKEGRKNTSPKEKEEGKKKESTCTLSSRSVQLHARTLLVCPNQPTQPPAWIPSSAPYLPSLPSLFLSMLLLFPFHACLLFSPRLVSSRLIPSIETDRQTDTSGVQIISLVLCLPELSGFIGPVKDEASVRRLGVLVDRVELHAEVVILCKVRHGHRPARPRERFLEVLSCDLGAGVLLFSLHRFVSSSLPELISGNRISDGSLGTSLAELRKICPGKALSLLSDKGNRYVRGHRTFSEGGL